MGDADQLKSLEFLLPEKILSPIYNVCHQALKHSDSHPHVLKAVQQLVVILRTQSRKSIGVDSADVLLLVELLKKADPESSDRFRKRNRDVLQLLRSDQINDDRLTAAQEIRHVWRAFGRLLGITSSHYGSKLDKSKKRRKPPTPIDVMSDDELSVWAERYQPWYKQAYKKPVGTITNAQLVLDCLLYDVVPEDLDKREYLKKGTTRKILLKELDIYTFGPSVK